uniref:Secreted protein n=1 Tax=Caenorhabditis tropicalis TaxID=1561998 RepID=A0A1I7U7F9_9PELO
MLLLSTSLLLLISTVSSDDIPQYGPISAHFDSWLDRNGYGKFDFSRLDLGTAGSFGGMSSEMQYASYGRLLYQVVASSNSRTPTFALRFDGQNFQKITEQPSGCLSSPISQIRFSLRNRNLIYLPSDDGLICLIHPSGVRSDLLLREAQMSGVLPCLAPTAKPEKQNCTQLITPICKYPNETMTETDQLNGIWLLYSSDPMFVLNWRCTFKDGDDDYSHSFECFLNLGSENVNVRHVELFI